MNILLVEDEAPIADFLQRGLKSEGWTVTLAPDGETAAALLAEDTFDAVILDVMLPGLSGCEICRRMRARNDITPVLMLTALDQTDERVNGLRSGADDYLAKPFAFDELVARIEALVRRANRFEQAGDGRRVLTAAALRLDTRSLELRCGDQAVELSTKEREILTLLMSSPGRVHSRERILNAVWQVSEDPLTNVVDVYVSRLRKKLGPCGPMIRTVRGAGYRLSPDE